MQRTQQEAKQFLSEIPFLHSGGCLISAYAYFLNEVLSKRLAPNIIQIGSREEQRNNKYFLKSEFVEACSAGHFGWKYGWDSAIYDAHGQYMASPYQSTLQIPKSKTDKFCVNALNHGSWNTMFNRKYWIPVIMEFFGLQGTDFSRVNSNV